MFQVLSNLAIKILFSFLGILNSFAIAKFMGIEDAGYTLFFINTVVLLAIFLRVGLDIPVTREVGRGRGKNFRKGVVSSIHTSFVVMVCLSFISFVICLLVNSVFTNNFDFQLIVYSIPGAFIMGFTVVLGYLYIGMGYPRLAQLAHGGTTSVAFLIGLCCIYVASSTVNLFQVLLVYNICLIVSLLFALYPILSKKRFRNAPRHFNKKLFLTSVKSYWLPRVLFTSFNYLPVIIVGILGTPNETAIYGVVAKVVLVLSMINETVINYFTSKIAAAFKFKSSNKVASLSKKVTGLNTVLSLPAVIVIIYFSPSLLLFVGSNYVVGSEVISILLVMHFCSLIFGPVRLLLAMASCEDVLIKSSLISFIFFVIGGIVLFREFGIIGLALAQGGAIIFNSVYCCYHLYRREGINPLASLETYYDIFKFRI